MDLWTELRKLKGTTLRTLDRGNPFQILDVTSTAVIVNPGVSKKERRIERKNIESAFKELMLRGEITRVTIQAKHSQYNPAYVAALLSALPGVSVTTSPIKLRYKRPTPNVGAGSPAPTARARHPLSATPVPTSYPQPLPHPKNPLAQLDRTLSVTKIRDENPVPARTAQYF